MRKNVKIVAGAALLASMTALGGCGAITSLHTRPTPEPELLTEAPVNIRDALIEVVYGPPPTDQEPVQSPVPMPTDFSWVTREADEIYDVYGPPSWFENGLDEEIEEDLSFEEE